jgi:hypothetical protein
MFAVASLLAALYATPAAALPTVGLLTNVSGSFFEPTIGGVSAFEQKTATVGILESNVTAGAVLSYMSPGFPDPLEVTMFARSGAVSDYGLNGAGVKLGLAATSGTDRGTFPNGQLTDLKLNSSLLPQVLAESRWSDTYTITGGTGVGSATISVLLRGTIASGYGDTGDIWYRSQQMFEDFGRGGSGSVEYRLGVSYVGDPFHYGSDGPPLVIREQPDASKPLPDTATILGPGQMLTGTFDFLYDVPFSLTGSLSLSGFNQVDFDFLHTASISLFDIPDGATLTSASGHIYVTEAAAAVPEPATLALLGLGLAGLGLRRRKRTAN